jgi:hypothetical protein
LDILRIGIRRRRSNKMRMRALKIDFNFLNSISSHGNISEYISYHFKRENFA